jgi:hypothetical protein
MVVTFDIGDQSFDYYSEVAWETQLNTWLEELGDVAEGLTTSNADEIVELMYGGELCFHRVPTN